MSDLRAGRRARMIPGQRLVNLVVRGLLRTPGLSALIGTRLLTLYVVGRKSGRRYSVPVAYLADGDDLLLGTLSGGEQQMLALSRAYLTRPKLVLVDEASLGLAPLIVDKIYVSYDIAREAADRPGCTFHAVAGSDHGFDSREREDEAIEATARWLVWQLAGRTL